MVYHCDHPKQAVPLIPNDTTQSEAGYRVRTDQSPTDRPMSNSNSSRELSKSARSPLEVDYSPKNSSQVQRTCYAWWLLYSATHRGGVRRRRSIRTQFVALGFGFRGVENKQEKVDRHAYERRAHHRLFIKYTGPSSIATPEVGCIPHHVHTV